MCDRAVDFVQELRSVLTMAFGKRPVVLVGSSFGGRLAVDFALRHPGRVAGLLLVGPDLSGSELSDDRRARIARLVAAAERGGDALADAWLRDRHFTAHRFSPTVRELVRTTLRDNVELFVAAPAAVAPSPAVDRLVRIAVPRDVFVGELDDADSHSTARAITQGSQALRLHRLPGCGHFPMLERDGWLPRALERLLAKTAAIR